MTKKKKFVVVKGPNKNKIVVGKGDSDFSEILNEKIDSERIKNEIIKVGIEKSEKYGSIIAFNIIFYELNKKFNNQISAHRCKKMIRKLDKKNLIKIIKLEDTFELIQYRPLDLDEKTLKILQLASTCGVLSKEEVSSKLKINLLEAESILDALVSRNIAKTTENILNGKKFYFPGLFQKE